MSEWLELELADRLAPVRAPERLWYLAQTPGPMAAARARRPLKAVLLLAAAAAASVWVATAWRPETRSAQSLVVRVNSADMACRSCHSD
jgi:hypothetical protein